MTSKINAEWHTAHRMPKNPTHDQRMAWHQEHSANCQCRELTPKLRRELEEWLAARAGTGEVRTAG